MKSLISYSLIAAALASGAFAAEATTTPVGYVTQTLAGNPSGGFFGADTYISPTLPQPSVFAGSTTSAPSGSSATFSSAVPTGLNSTYIIELADGAREGWWSVISASTATSVTTVSPFPAGLAANVKVSIRKIDTLQSFLGENTLGLGPTDQVQILDPVTQITKTAIFVGGEWQDIVTENNLDNELIYPGTAVKVKIFGATGKTLVTAGTVKLTKTELDLYPGSNWLPATFAVGGTFGKMGFGAQLIEEDFNPSTTPADVIQVIAPDQSASSYVRIGTGIQNLVTEEDASAVPVDGAAGYIIKRSAAAPAGTVSVPAQTVAN